MNLRALWAGGHPAVFVGFALGVNAPLSAGLLLYSGMGFARALAFFLAVLLLSLAVGLSATLAPEGAMNPDRVRGRWTWLLATFAAAALFAAGWEGFRGFGVTGVSQGAGLALLVALPMHAAGRVLASFNQLGETSSAPPALFGAGIGVLFLGLVFFPRLSPATTLLLCITVLSVGALRHGRQLRVEQDRCARL